MNQTARTSASHSPLAPRRLATALVCLSGLVSLCGVASALELSVGEIRFTWDCEADRMAMSNGNVLDGTEKEFEITGLDRSQLVYKFTGQRITADLARVADVCFGDPPRSWLQASEAWDAKNFPAAGGLFEQASRDQSADGFWVQQFGLFLAGRSYLYSGDVAKADAAYGELDRRAPKHIFSAEMRLDRIKILAGTGKIAEAVKLIDSALDDRDLPDTERYELLFLKGELHEQLKQWSDATRAYDDAEALCGRFDGVEASRCKQRCSLARARVSIGQGNIAGARTEATKVLRQTEFADETQHEARAFAINILGDCFYAEALAIAGKPAEARSLMEKALERYLKVVAVYGGDESVASTIRGHAFNRTIELAGPTRLNDRELLGATKGKAANYGF